METRSDITSISHFYSVHVLLVCALLTIGPLSVQAQPTWRVLTGVLNLNTASQQDLQLLPGVGMVTAYRIVRFRQQIGGFKTIADLARVPGLRASLVTRLQPYVTLSGPSTLRVLLDLNSATPEALARLPGLSMRQAQAIVAFRQRNGAFRHVEDLLLVGGIEPQHLEEIRALVTVLPPPATP